MSELKGGWGRVIKRYDNGDPFISVKNEHLMKKRKLRWYKYVKGFILVLPWLVFTIIWNFNWQDATPLDDVFVATCLFLFNRSFMREL